MKIKIINKTISILLTFIFIAGLFPPVVLAQQSPVSQIGEVRGFNRSVFDSHFSRADREIDVQRWLTQARLGLTQGLNAWELTAGRLYENPVFFEEARGQVERWGEEELERRFSQWLIGRFFGEAVERVMLGFSHEFAETQRNYTWHIDEDGNILFDDRTGTPLVIRPYEDGREFSQDLLLWRNEAQEIVRSTSVTFDTVMLLLYPELLAYIPVELRQTMSAVIYETAAVRTVSVRRDFEIIAQREESIFTSRRTRDILSLRNRSDNEAAGKFTERLIAETEEVSRAGIEELNSRIEQAAAGAGDLAILGEEWLKLYKEQFDRGLRAWEEAEERFFIRRIEWEQEASRLFSEGQETWLAAFSQFEEQRRLWELQARELFLAGEMMFINISQEFAKNVEAAKKEFEINMAMRIGEGTARVKALIDMYLTSSSAAITAMGNYKFWESHNNRAEMQRAEDAHVRHMANAIDARERILANYAELLGTGALKDILSPDVSSEDFFLDEYQIALVRAQALVLYWERKTAIAQAVTAYAVDLSAGRITEAEGLQVWEAARAAYNASVVAYESELKKLGQIDIHRQQEILQNLTLELQREEAELMRLSAEYTSLNSIAAVSRENLLRLELNAMYDSLVEAYELFLKTGNDSIYLAALENGMKWGIAENGITSEEVWQETLNSLGELFSSFGFEPAQNFFPDIHNFCRSILEKEGNFVQNTVNFLVGFDSLIQNLPQWLIYELENWKGVLLEYIAIYAFYTGTLPRESLAELAIEQEKLLGEYFELLMLVEIFDFENIDLENIDDELIEIIELINTEFIRITGAMQALSYASFITGTWEGIRAASLEKEQHWRQYQNSHDIAVVSSWEEGVLQDTLFKAVYFTNRINDAFTMYSQREEVEINEDAYHYAILYHEEFSQTAFFLNAVESLYNNIVNTTKDYEFAGLNPDELKSQLLAAEAAFKAQEEKYNELWNKYSAEAAEFYSIGVTYDQQYSISKSAYEFKDQMRFEYEKQDAIQRWASTAYLGADTINLEYNMENLVRAQTVLQVLSDLYSGEDRRAYDDPQYNALFAAYEQSFVRKMAALQAADAVLSAIEKEKENNNRLFAEYQRSLNMFSGFINPEMFGQVSPENISQWTARDVVIVRDGRLVFNTGSGWTFTVKNETNVNELADFFNTTNITGNAQHETSRFEEAVKDLSERMAGYLRNADKAKQLGLARNHLILQLRKANGDLSFLRYTGAGELRPGGNTGNLWTRSGPFKKNERLIDAIGKDFIFAGAENMFHYAWDTLSAQERADLEFYVILTLTGNNNYMRGFSEFYALDAYQHAYNYVNEHYLHAQKMTSTLPTIFMIGINQLVWREMRDVNYSTLRAIQPVLNQTRNFVNGWTSGLQDNSRNIRNFHSSYLTSCQKLEDLKGVMIDGTIGWAQISLSLSKTGKYKEEEINALRPYWDTMRVQAADNVYQDVPEALLALFYWTAREEALAKAALETKSRSAAQEQRINENNFLSAVDAYISGAADDIGALRIAANRAYGTSAFAIKTHLEKMHGVMIDNLSMYMEMEVNFPNEFSIIGNELAELTETMLRSRYEAELAAREAQWEIALRDLMEKFFEWQETAALILENGRMDWITSRQKMEAAYVSWQINFQNEYERVSLDWALAYLAGLEDKEKWLEMAAEAANNASSQALLQLIGAEGERLARFMDIREPIGMIGVIPQAQSLMTELLQSSGIANMASAFGSMNNIANTVSVNVRQGMGGVSIWNSGNVRVAASDMARSTNAEIAAAEARKLAFQVQAAAEEAVKGLKRHIETANQNVRENMDDVFIFNGHWTKNGNDYKKQIITGSTFFTPVLSQMATIRGFTNFVLEPVVLKTNLEQSSLENLDTIAIRLLLESAYNEVEVLAEEVFGIGKDPISINRGRELSPGRFGSHIGYGPATRENIGESTTRKDMFYDEGAGEIGRLISEFTYWAIIHSTGSEELAIAPWDRRMWDDSNSFFNAPTLRQVGTIAGGIAVGIATGGAGFAGLGFVGTVLATAAISTASEFVFSSLDAVYGYKTFDEAAFSIGKSFLTNTVTSAAGGLFSGVEGASSSFLQNGLTKTVMGNVNGTFNTIAAQTMMTGLQTAATATLTSAIAGVTYSSQNGWGYNNDVFNAGLGNMWTSTLTSMTSTFTTSGLTAINSGFDGSRLIGFNSGQRFDQQNFNGLIGSLAGQGINYAFGGNFTLNALNLSMFSNDPRYNSGLLELHFGRDGASMNFGTGGANVSFDNLASAMRGLQVWGVNSQISSYGRKNDFDALISLRAQYGYGDQTQVGQLWDILRGDTLLNFTEGDYRGMTELVNGQRVVNLTGYQSGMSPEEQFLLAAILGHEAYRDGLGFGNNTQGAALAHTEMAFRMLFGGETIAYDANLAEDFIAYFTALARNDIGVFNAYVDANYDSSADFWRLTRQNNGTWLWEDDRNADFDIRELHQNDYFYSTFSASSMNIMQAMIFSHERDGKEYGVISNHRMTNALANEFGRVITRIAEYDLMNRFLNNMHSSFIGSAMIVDTLDKIAYNAANTFTVWDSQNRPITMHNINSLNDADLLKQTYFKGDDLKNLFNFGCNFMGIIGVSQMLFRNELTDQQIIEIWNEAKAKEINGEKIMTDTGFVKNREAIAELALLKMGITNIGIDFESTLNQNAVLAGYRMQMPFGTNSLHFVITGTNQSLVYNPSNIWSNDKDKYSYLSIWVYGK